MAAEVARPGRSMGTENTKPSDTLLTLYASHDTAERAKDEPKHRKEGEDALRAYTVDGNATVGEGSIRMLWAYSSTRPASRRRSTER